MKRAILILAISFVFISLFVQGEASAEILNPSFEDYMTGWGTYNDIGMNRYIETTFATDGQYNLQLFTESDTSNTKGDKSGIYQNVSLTDVGQILFDVKLSSHNYGNPSVFRDYTALFLIDGTTYWSETVADIYLDQYVDVSALSGNHQIELRLECIQDENYNPSIWAEWDNLRVAAVPEPSTMMLLLGLGGLMLHRKKH